ncbi:MAG: site-specific integrase [Clostridia bacterium]|nr:site-specific integrase [Clostridia bacterium]
MSRRAPGEGNISKRADGYWTARIQVGSNENGKQRIKAFYGKTRKEVAEKLADYREMTRAGYGDEDLPDFDRYIKNWLYNVKANELKALSFDRLESTINNHIIPCIGHIKTNQLTDLTIQIELINKKSKDMSYSSLKKIYDALNACFKYAVARRNLRFNPMNTVTMPSKSKFETKEVEIFSDDEIKKITEAASARFGNGTLKYKNGWAFILMIYTGMRMGEMLALKWQDFNEEARTLTIKRNIALVKNRMAKGTNYKLVEQDSLKTQNSERVIPLSLMAITALAELRKTSKNYVISTADGKPVRPRNFQNTFDSVLKYAGIGHKGLHATRHTFASLLFKRGADVKTVCELLGHGDTRTTYNTYIHIIKEQKHETISLLDGI